MIGDSLESVQKKIDSRRAKVYTASEFKDMVRRRDPSSREADVVTCGTFGVMSGTMAILCVSVAEAGTFKRADTITLNGVPATVSSTAWSTGHRAATVRTEADIFSGTWSPGRA